MHTAHLGCFKPKCKFIVTLRKNSALIAVLGLTGLCLAGVIDFGQNKAKTGTSSLHSAAKESSPAVSQTAHWGVSPFGNEWFALTSLDSVIAVQGSTDAVYGRGGRAIDFGGKSADQYVAQHIGAARTGDMKAAYEVYKAEAVCANSDEPVADYQDAGEREQFLRQREGLRKLCKGMSLAQVQERMVFLAAAARAGNAEAQIDFYMEGPPGTLRNPSVNGDDPAVKQWKEDAIDFLKQAAAKCDRFALGLLSTVYDAGNIVEHSDKLSMAYGVADSLARRIPVTPAQLRNRFGEQVATTELEEAIQLGTGMVNQSCKL